MAVLAIALQAVGLVLLVAFATVVWPPGGLCVAGLIAVGIGIQLERSVPTDVGPDDS